MAFSDIPWCFQEGYESRHVGYSVYKHSMIAIGSDEDVGLCARSVMMQMAYNALPVTEVSVGLFLLLLGSFSDQPCLQVPAVAHSFLTRGVNSGALALTCCVLRELHVPILDINDLRDFFLTDEVCILNSHRAYPGLA